MHIVLERFNVNFQLCSELRGDLWISWEEGMKVFDELLLDADWAVNAGMWMWLSSSSFFQQFFHCYCPVRFGRRADPNGDYKIAKSYILFLICNTYYALICLSMRQVIIFASISQF